MKFGTAASETRGPLMKFTDDTGPHRIAPLLLILLLLTPRYYVPYLSSHPVRHCTIESFVNVPYHFIGTVWIEDQIKRPMSQIVGAVHSLYSKKLRKCKNARRQKHHVIHAMAMDRAKQKREANKTPEHQSVMRK